MTLANVIAHNLRMNRKKIRADIERIEEGVEREADLHDAVSKFCKERGWITFHGSMAHRAMRTLGEPDYTVIADRGRVFFVECKTKTGKLKPEQLALKVWAEKLGHTIHTVRSIEEFKKITA